MERQTRDARGRVVLRMRGGAASPLAVEAAMRLARAFRGELRGLFIEDEDLLSLAGLPFAQEISLTGRRSRPLSIELVREEMGAASKAMEREFARLTRAARVPARFEVVQGVAEDALRSVMKEGILAIGEPLTLAGRSAIHGMMSELSGLAGIVLVGGEARRAEGPVLAVIDAESNVALMVDTAEALARLGGESVVLILDAEKPDEAARLEQQAREALDRDTRCHFERMESVTARTVGFLARRAAGGIVVAGFGGLLARDETDAMRTACTLDCPLLLLSGAGGWNARRGAATRES